MMEQWLQYGAFGLLAVVLGAAGKYFYERDKKQATFVQGLAETAMSQQSAHTKAWYEMASLMVTAQVTDADQLKQLREKIEEHKREHEQEMARQHTVLSAQMTREISRVQGVLDK